MTSRKKSSDSTRRERRGFTEEFKAEAVRLMHERQARGGTLAQVGRELDVRPDQLREWARRLSDRAGGLKAVGIVETSEQELRRLRRENARLLEEREFAKKVAVYFAKESR